jgi:hypothetical protein
LFKKNKTRIGPALERGREEAAASRIASEEKKKNVCNSLNYCQTVTAFLDYPAFLIGYYNSRFHDNEVRNPAVAEGYGYIPSFLL